MRTIVYILFSVYSLAVFAGEQTLTLNNGEYEIPTIFQTPDEGGNFPAVLLLHGTASHKNEVGNLFQRLATKLAANGIASLRFDFAGNGDSAVSYTRYTPASAIRDATTAQAYLHQQGIQRNRTVVLGFSQGGHIAMMLVERHPDYAGLVTWSTEAGDGIEPFRDMFDKYYSEAKQRGKATMTFEWREPLEISLNWFEQMKQQTTLTDLRRFTHPLLAIGGSADSVADANRLIDMLNQSGSDDARAVIIKGANHIYNSLDPQAKQDDRLLTITDRWLTDLLY